MLAVATAEFICLLLGGAWLSAKRHSSKGLAQLNGLHIWIFVLCFFAIIIIQLLANMLIERSLKVRRRALRNFARFALPAALSRVLISAEITAAENASNFLELEVRSAKARARLALWKRHTFPAVFDNFLSVLLGGHTERIASSYNKLRP